LSDVLNQYSVLKDLKGVWDVNLDLKQELLRTAAAWGFASLSQRKKSQHLSWDFNMCRLEASHSLILYILTEGEWLVEKRERESIHHHSWFLLSFLFKMLYRLLKFAITASDFICKETLSVTL
jgi:hypothetical protein